MNGLLVKNGGLLSSIQDSGRVGLCDIGLTQSGAMDELAFGYANMLLGNPLNTPCIEIAYGGAIFEVKGEISLVVCGAQIELTCNDISLALWQTHTLKNGDILKFDFASEGNFAYLGVAGGFDIRKEYASFSTCIKEGLGGFEGRKLRKDDFLRTPHKIFKERRKLKNELLPTYPKELNLRVLLGYQENCFSKESKEIFFSSTYTYDGVGDRMGYRLSGESIKSNRDGILSEAISFGSIQVPPSGEPIILLKEHQTIGGYPKLGALITPDCFRLAQLRSGGKVTFEAIELQEAQEITKKFYQAFR